MVERQALDLVERQQDSGKEGLVLFLERQGETVDDGPQNLEQLGDAVVTLSFVDECVKDVVDRPSDEGPQIEEFAVNPMECRLEEVSFPRVFAVKEVEQLCVTLTEPSVSRHRDHNSNNAHSAQNLGRCTASRHWC